MDLWKKEMILFFTQTDVCKATEVGRVLKDPAVLISYYGLHEDKWPPTVALWKKLKEARLRYDARRTSKRDKVRS